MDWNAIYPGPEEPTAEQLSAYVSHPLWEPLNRWICEAYSLSPIYSYSNCSMGRGWNVKYRSGGKALCTLYPASGGQQRIVEILLTYPEDTQALRQKSDDLQSTADALVLPLRPHQLSPSARQAELFSLVREHVRARPDGGPTAWDALLGDGADSEGLALTFQLLSGKMEVGSVLVEGTLNGEPHFWNQLTADGGAHYVDLTRDTSGTTYSAADLLSLGYVWEGAEENAENLN